MYLCLTANLSSTYSYLYAQAAVSLIFKGTKRRTKEELQKLLFEDCIEVSSMQSYVYSTAQFELEGKSRVVMRAHTMPLISVAFSSVSACKTFCLKNTYRYILCKHTCTSCAFVCVHKTMQHESTCTHEWPF